MFKTALVTAAADREVVEDVKLAIAEFYNLLKLAKKKVPIPSCRFEYFERQLIDIRVSFFDKFIED